MDLAWQLVSVSMNCNTNYSRGHVFSMEYNQRLLVALTAPSWFDATKDLGHGDHGSGDFNAFWVHSAYEHTG